MHWKNFTYFSGGSGMISYGMNLRNVQLAAYLNKVPMKLLFPLYDFMAGFLGTWTVLVLIFNSALSIHVT